MPAPGRNGGDAGKIDGAEGGHEVAGMPPAKTSRDRSLA